MDHLDLDAEERFPLTEDTEEECVLCKRYNYDYLLEIQAAMVETASVSNMYDVMYKAFCERMELLKKQQMQYVEISKVDFVRHFENHVLSFHRICSRDIRLIHNMQKVLLETMRTNNGLNPNSLSSWMRLSAYKISIASKMKKNFNGSKKRKIKPYAFDWVYMLDKFL